MHIYNKYFVFLQLLVQTFSVASYTVVLKQVKPLFPSVKVYRYELRHAKILPESNGQFIYSKPLLSQKIYPVVVKPGRDVHFKTRVPIKKENGKLYKVSSTTEKPVLRDPRLLGLSQYLVPPVSNQIEEYSETKEEEEVREEENDIRPLLPSPHASKSFSSFGQNKGKIYSNPGEWVTPEPKVNPENSSNAEFTPSQLYLQIRHKNTVIHVPQSEALKDAETLEELINAPRLKELSRTTHVQETYSEEGYEDAGYDHAGHLRQAQHGEVYDAKDEGRFNIKEAPIILDYDSDLGESQKVPLKTENDNLLPSEGNLSNKLEPRITRSRSEVSKTSVEYAKVPKNYKGEHKYSSRVKNPVKTYDEKESQFNSTDMKEFPTVQGIFPSYFGEMPPSPEKTLTNNSVVSNEPIVKKSSKYRKGDFNSTKIYPVSETTSSETFSPVSEYTDFKPYISLIDSQASPSVKSLKYSRIYSKKTKQLRLEPYKNGNIYSPPPPPPPPPSPPLSPTSELLPHDDLQPPNIPDETEREESINQRIVLPTIGYINSLTTAHFGKGNANPAEKDSNSQLTDALNLTQALNYLRSNKNQQNLEVTKSPTEIDFRTFEPMKLKKPRFNAHSFVNKTKRDVYLMGIRGKRSDIKSEEYEGNDESDLPHNEKNEEIAEDERKRIEEENREKKKYEEHLKSEISKQEKEILKQTFKNIGVEEDVSEVFPEFPSSGSDSFSEHSSIPFETTPRPINIRKYPFYKSNRLPENSALRYATHPRQFPKKSGYGMEFYESREQIIQCPDFHPDLKDLPDSNSTEYSDEQPGENQRLKGLGDKIACLRMKYFDPEPFDNPLFIEKEIDYVGKPVKGRIKIQTKTLPKTLGLKKDETLQKASYDKSYGNKSKNQKLDKKLHGVHINQPAHTNYAGQATTFQKIINQSAAISKMFIPQISHFENDKNIKIPVTQEVQNITLPGPPVEWKAPYRFNAQSQTASKPENGNRILKSHNCLPLISQLLVLEGTKNVTIDCNDVILIQEIIKNIPYLKIIPKEKKIIKKKQDEKISLQSSSHQTDWVPIISYTIPKHSNLSAKPLSRRTDEVTKHKNETGENTSSAHYVIDELKEDENVRKGEVVEDTAHYMKMIEDLKDDLKEVTTVKTEFKTENSTRRKREAQNEAVKPKKESSFSKLLEFSLEKALQAQSSTNRDTDKISDELSTPSLRTFEMKRPLKRLSGLDFLVRYHKNKGKHSTQRTADFWKITTQGPITDNNTNKSQKKSIEIVMHTTSRNADDKPDKTILTKTVETTTKYLIKEASEFRKRQTKSPSEKLTKPKSRQINEPRKISPLNLIPEKVTKRPADRTSEVWKITPQISVSEKTTPKPVNFSKIVTKVSTRTSETSEKPRIIHKQATPHLNQSFSTETPSGKPETLQYKTINRNSSSLLNKDSVQLSTSTENPIGPTLYYVVDLKTGRGKWITNYDEKLWSSGKEKSQRVKEISGTKKGKRRKKLKN